MRRTIAELFGRSPFRSLAKHTERCHETVTLLRPLFDAFIHERWDEVDSTFREISRLEHEADTVKNELRDHLPKSLFLPVDRSDVLLYLKEQDSIADAAETLGVMLTMRHTPTPEPMCQPVLEFVDHVIQASQLWYATASELPLLQEASFTGPEVQKTMERIRELSDLQLEAERKEVALSRLLFQHEQQFDPISVVLWMRILHEIGEIASHAENTADHLRLMLARR